MPHASFTSILVRLFLINDANVSLCGFDFLDCRYYRCHFFLVHLEANCDYCNFFFVTNFLVRRFVVAQVSSSEEDGDDELEEDEEEEETEQLGDTT